MAVFLVLAAVSVGLIVGRSLTEPAQPETAAAVTKQSAVLQDSDWLSERYWRRRRLKNLNARQTPGRDRPGGNPFDSGAQPRPQATTAYGGSFRTVCVRLCDGYYFPISAATGRNNFAADEQKCQSKCSSDARLFYYSNAGGSPETMRDRRGRAYADLKTAFLYRAVYDKTCQCRPDPWSEEAQQRHAMYATPAWQKRARRLARLEERRARRLRHRQVTQPAPAVIPWNNGHQNAALAGTPPPSAYSGLPTQPVARPIPRQQYSEVRMGLGRSATIPRRQPRRRSRNWRHGAFSQEQ